MKFEPSATVTACPLASARAARLVGLGLASITLLVYLPSAWHGFILEDDPQYVTENPVVTGGLSWAGLQWAFFGWHASN